MYTQYQNFKTKQKLLPTSVDIEGPFYKEGAPECKLLVEKPTLTLSGRVVDVEGKPVEALLDFWQADEKGTYDNDGFHLRGKQKASKDGSYILGTVKPGHYPIGDNEYRCSHIHVKLSGEGVKPLTTQLYFADDEYDKADHWFDAKRCVTVLDEGHVGFEFVLEKA